MFFEHQIIFFSILLSFLIAFILLIVIFIIKYSNIDIEKVSSYECGFHPFEDTRQKFNIRYYLVSILFLVFDLEIIYLFPWILISDFIEIEVFLVLLLFFIVLLIGFIYEWMKGALTWE